VHRSINETDVRFALAQMQAALAEMGISPRAAAARHAARRRAPRGGHGTGRPFRLRLLLPVVACWACSPPAPAAAQQVRLAADRAAQVALGVVGVTSLPDGTVSDLTIDRSGGESSQLFTWQLGVGFTVAEEFPLYLEGFLGYARCDPVAIVSSGQQTARLPLRWNAFSGTGGVGWSFAINDRLQLRPILHFRLGYITSDVALGAQLLDALTGIDIQASQAGQAATGGLCGALVLAWYDYQPEYEFKMELRLSRMRFATLPVSDRGLDVRSDSAAAGLWTRYRWPTGAEAFGRPTRWVLEGYHSEFFRAQRDVRGISQLTRLGGGIEADVGRWELGGLGLYLQRVRLSGGLLFGDGVRGWSVGIGMSF
jgi:hypothetical protein